jgi:Mrp family chromosome partitioning ATPase
MFNGACGMNAEILGAPLHADGGSALPPFDLLDALEVSSETLAEQHIFGFRHADTRARPFKLLRSQLRKQCEVHNFRVIGVTSASPGVGKSFVAANLAAALSRLAGVEVYLVDLDLHRPALAGRFGLSEGNGILEYLAGDVVSLRSVAKRINDQRLALLPAFRANLRTSELLASERGDRLFASFHSLPSTAIVIVDMPPIFADDDAVIIAAKLDAFLLIAQDGKTTQKQVRDTIRLLHPTPLLGTVLNRYRNQFLSDDYGYGIGYGYGAYYNNDEA